MMKRKEFILGAAFGLTLTAAATAGGVIRWPEARADHPAAARTALFGQPPGAPESFADIFDQVSPAVVQIDVRARIARRPGLRLPDLPFGPRSPDNEGGAAPETGDEPTALGAGSGFFISADGYIVTNNHVIENAEEISVRLSDGRALKATLVGRDEETDLAVIKVEGRDFPFVTFEESVEPRVGDWVVAVGNPFGLGGTATAGIVSARGRVVDSNYVDYIQIDAAINRGNSGGPTFDVHGRVIGVNSAIISPTGGSVGIGFAIPASVAKPITERLMRGASVERGYLGVQIGDLEPFREALGLPEGVRGALVASVTPDGPAAQGGLRGGDVVLAVNDRPVATSTELTRRVGEARAGDRLKLSISRDGRPMTVTVRSGTRPSRAELEASARGETRPAPAADLHFPEGQAVGGLKVAPLTAELRRALGLADSVQGVVVTGLAEGGDRRFQPGFVIFRAGNGPVRSVQDLETAVAAARRAGRDDVFVMVRTPAADETALLDLPKAD